MNVLNWKSKKCERETYRRHCEGCNDPPMVVMQWKSWVPSVSPEGEWTGLRLSVILAKGTQKLHHTSFHNHTSEKDIGKVDDKLASFCSLGHVLKPSFSANLTSYCSLIDKKGKCWKTIIRISPLKMSLHSPTTIANETRPAASTERHILVTETHFCHLDHFSDIFICVSINIACRWLSRLYPILLLSTLDTAHRTCSIC